VTVRLRGDLVTLRAFREEEFDAVVDREAPPDAPEETRGKIRERLWRSGDWADGELRMAVEAEGELVGDCQVRTSAWAMPPGVAEIGIALFEDATGHGYGTDTLRVLCTRLFDDDGVHRVQLSTDVDNAAMRRAAEKAGFTFEGVLRGFWRQDDGLHDYAMYGRSRADHGGGR
jgi:RimJ/RimL family protein N-acetyltransferase